MSAKDSLADRLRSDEFAGYAYAYPHKSSYRPLNPAIKLDEAWSNENKDAVFLYVHLPFCEMRCGFCNLFTTVQPPEELVADTLVALQRQSEVVCDSVRPRRISQLAFGGGTPSFLSVAELQQLFQKLDSCWPIHWQNAPTSFEVSPATVDAEKVSLLRSWHVDRLSMGVQSFSSDDLRGLGRPQQLSDVERAIALIKDQQFPIFNLDLIYGAARQGAESWRRTVAQAISYDPEEIYLYPLYVRELTGLGRTGNAPSQFRRNLYFIARDLLLEHGYRQHSMRLFRKADIKVATEHRCQEDGMIGLGPGARSYTRELHYSSEFAVGQTGVRQIIADFNQRDTQAFATADYGAWLDSDEQRRRYIIKSLLRCEGLSISKYADWFQTNPLEDFPQLTELFDLDLASLVAGKLVLNEQGIACSDVIGPWLYSPAVHVRMEEFELI